MAPDAWFWAHDARPDQLDTLAAPGQRLVRLSWYAPGRYAALFHSVHSGSVSHCELDLDAGAMSVRKDAIAVTADDRGRFSAVVDPGASTIAHVDLDEDEARSLTGEIVDVATYTLRGARRYTVLVRESSTPSWLLPDLTMADLQTELDRLAMSVVRLRAQGDSGRFTAVVTRTGSTYYAALDADGVERQLERHRAYPSDLDAVRTRDGV